MAKHEDLVSRVAIHVSPCPEQAILDALKSIVREFCKKTNCWVFDVPSFSTQSGEMRYMLDIPNDSVITHVWGIKGRNGEYSAEQHYYLNHPNILQFNKAPNIQPIDALVSLMPTANSEEFPDFLNDYFGNYLVSGAVAHLQRQPFRDWSQPNAYAVHEAEYEQGITEAIQLRDQGLNKSKLRNRVKAQYL